MTADATPAPPVKPPHTFSPKAPPARLSERILALPRLRATRTFSELEIPAHAWDAIRDGIATAGPDYLERYLHDERTIVFTGSEVGLVRSEKASRPAVRVISETIFRNSVIERSGCVRLAKKIVAALRRRRKLR